MKILTGLVISIAILTGVLSCRGNQEAVYLVENGNPVLLKDVGEDWSREDGYLLSEGEFYLNPGGAINVGDFSMKIRLEYDFGEESILNLLVADIRFSTHLWEEDDLPLFFLEGPCFTSSFESERDPSDLFQGTGAVEIEMTYKSGILVCKVGGEKIFSEEVFTEPFGRVNLGGWTKDGSLKVYDWSLTGEMIDPEICYTRERLLDRAQKSVDHMATKVKDDPNRPIYHIQPPANWNNDPNGTMQYKGTYHMFYQHNPFSDRWGWMHWGHMTSTDLVHWEHQPIALWPSLERGEEHCFSGSAIINRKGEPMLFYTSIGHDYPEHWVAIPADDQLLTWEKHPDNPILTMDDHKGQIIVDWRDPQIIHEGDKTLMVIGGHPEDAGGSIMLYKANNIELTDWEYLGVAFSGEEGNWECPNFFRVGDSWIIINSPHGRVRYYSGDFDLDKYKYEPRRFEYVDHGPNFYAPNTTEDEQGRRLLWGWIPDFKWDQGWQGAITIPRVVTTNNAGWLIQEPAPELSALRSEHQHTDEFILSGNKELQVPGREFESEITFRNNSASFYGIEFLTEEGPFRISIESDRIMFGDTEIPTEQYDLPAELSVRIFFDRTILEMYVEGGIICATAVLYPDTADPGWKIFSEGGDVSVTSVDIWKMGTIWK